MVVVVLAVGVASLSQWLLDAPALEPASTSWADDVPSTSHGDVVGRRVRSGTLAVLVPTAALGAAAVLVVTAPFDVWVWGVVVLLAATVALSPVLAVYHYDVRPLTPAEAERVRSARPDRECDVVVVADATDGTVNGYAIGGPFRDVVGISEFALETLSPDQIAALIAHETAHHREHHVLVRGTVSLVALGLGAAVVTALFDALVPASSALLLSTVLVERVLVYRVMRRLEYEADAVAVERTSTEAVTSLLSALEDVTGSRGTSTPLVTRLFSSHPTPEARIARLPR